MPLSSGPTVTRADRVATLDDCAKPRRGGLRTLICSEGHILRPKVAVVYSVSNAIFRRRFGFSCWSTIGAKSPKLKVVRGFEN